MVILILFSVLSGVVTVFSPCILPVLPIVLSSSAASGRSRPLGVITGLIISFSIFTLAISSIVASLGISATALRLAAVAIIGLLGLGMLLPALSTFFERAISWLPGLARTEANPGSGFGPGFFTGLSLGLVWAPCAGPILAAVTTLAATRSVTSGAVWVVLAYAVGAGIPLLVIAYGGRAAIQRMPALTRHPLRVQQVFGGVMLMTAVLIAFNADTLVTTWATDMIPASWTASLQSFESSQPVSQQLGKLTGNTTSQTQAKPTQPGEMVPKTGGNSFQAASLDLPNLGPAPEITGITNWINSAPLTLQDLRGKVVLIDFWTYSCINCIRTLPYVTSWYQKYKDDGFVVIGVHSPEFAFEHETPNVEAAVKRFDITYPVAQDNNFATWKAYNNSYWPAEYLIDAQGNIRETKFGEGNYDKTEKAIEALLADAGHTVNTSLTTLPTAQFSGMESPETYLGTNRLDPNSIVQVIHPTSPFTYELPATPGMNQFAVGGSWDFQPEYARASASGSTLVLHFFAQDVYLVMTSAVPVPVTVQLIQPDQTNQSDDINQQGKIDVKDSRLYHLVHLNQAAEGVVKLTFSQPGVEVYAFTFGG